MAEPVINQGLGQYWFIWGELTAIQIKEAKILLSCMNIVSLVSSPEYTDLKSPAGIDPLK